MLAPGDIREAMEIGESTVMEMVEALAEMHAPDGETWDVDKITDDREFIAWYIDLEQRPGPRPFSIMDYLPEIAPEFYQQITRRYERAIAKMGA